MLACKTGLACTGKIDFQQFYLFVLVAVTKRPVQFELDIEMIFNRAFIAARHKDKVLYPSGTSLIDNVLDDRTIHHGQHLFGDRLGGRQKTGA